MRIELRCLSKEAHVSGIIDLPCLLKREDSLAIHTDFSSPQVVLENLNVQGKLKTVSISRQTWRSFLLRQPEIHVKIPRRYRVMGS